VFKDAAGLGAVIAQEAHVIKGKNFFSKKVTCKKAEAKPGKIYVGKLPSEGITVVDIQTHFAPFGPVVEVECCTPSTRWALWPIDKSKNDEPKDFCFVTFEREETAKQILKEGSATINGHQIGIKKARANSKRTLGKVKCVVFKNYHRYILSECHKSQAPAFLKCSPLQSTPRSGKVPERPGRGAWF
jgi:RNA recognition motif-containing protein